MGPLVSIIIPTYNRGLLVGETLESIENQTYQNWECIVVDDGSSDHTESVVECYCKKDPRFLFFKRPDSLKKGANSCRNYGFNLSKGEYINWFDSDDVMLNNFLEEKIANFTDNCVFNVCTGFFVDERLNISSKMQFELKKSLYEGLLTWKLPIITNSVLVKRSFLEGRELFNENITRGQETEFFARIFFNIPDNRYKLIDTPLFLYRQHDDTITEENRRSYVPSHRNSQSYIALTNLKRSIEIGNFSLYHFLYETLIESFFLAIQNKNIRGALWILNKLIITKGVLSPKEKFVFLFLGLYSLKIKKGRWRIRRYFINKPIH